MASSGMRTGVQLLLVPATSAHAAMVKHPVWTLLELTSATATAAPWMVSALPARVEARAT